MMSSIVPSRQRISLALCGRGKGPVRSTGRVRGASDEMSLIEIRFFFRPAGRKSPHLSSPTRGEGWHVRCPSPSPFSLKEPEIFLQLPVGNMCVVAPPLLLLVTNECAEHLVAHHRARQLIRLEG